MRRSSGVARLCLVVASVVFAFGGASLAWADERVTIVEPSSQETQTESAAQTVVDKETTPSSEAATTPEGAADTETASSEPEVTDETVTPNAKTTDAAATSETETTDGLEVTESELQGLALDEDLDTSNYQAMYRLYNPYTGEHLYTASVNECTTLELIGWKFEGIGWIAPKVSEIPVYRLFNKYNDDHHYTTSSTERDALVKIGWTFEGIGWYSEDEATGKPLYRQFNPYAERGTHNYTTDKNENDTLAGIGWVAEGIAWYALETNDTSIASAAYDARATVLENHFSLVYDYSYYVEHNSDALSPSASRSEAITHFVTKGMDEGRRANATFDVKSYWLEYQDVRLAANGYYKGCYEHYMTNGYKEGRHPNGCTKLKTTSGASPQSLVLSYAKSTPSPGGGLCSEWVTEVFEKLGYHNDHGDARDHYWWYCTSSNRNELKVGMIIAVPSHSHTRLGKEYGHVCIYIGNGKIMDNVGYIRTMSLDKWLDHYDTTYTPKWGWFHGISLE